MCLSDWILARIEYWQTDRQTDMRSIGKRQSEAAAAAGAAGEGGSGAVDKQHCGLSCDELTFHLEGRGTTFDWHIPV